MVTIIVGTALTVVVAAGVVVFVAFPGRGRAIPRAGWVNGAVDRVARKLPEDLSAEFLPERR